ncbi:MAG: hypothetical protein C4576_26100 [Desulfobacteraceae bacterium]|nr:MAG: hypothetical protein C4576_26100 [Desulfobacteraceae bacterium]
MHREISFSGMYQSSLPVCREEQADAAFFPSTIEHFKCFEKDRPEPYWCSCHMPRFTKRKKVLMRE